MICYTTSTGMNKTIWKIIIVCIVLFAGASIAFGVMIVSQDNQIGEPGMTTITLEDETAESKPYGDDAIDADNQPEAEESQPETEHTALPAHVEHAVPFTSQAPFGNWDQPYQDACEEASLLMAHAGIVGMDLPSATADTELLKMIDFETDEKGWDHDITIDQLLVVAQEYYDYSTVRVDHAPTIQSIKQALADGNVVIAPMAGQLLGNPYYTPPGPEYHMLIIIGYDDAENQFITNDPGTKRGEGYRYSYTTAFNAIHDWIGAKETIQQGPKAVLIVPYVSATN